MRMGREVHQPTHFHQSPHPCRKRGPTNMLFPIQCLRTIAVTLEAACTLGRSNHSTRLHRNGRWRPVRIAVLATLQGIVEMSSNTHTHRPSMQIMIQACNHTPLRPVPPIILKFTIHVNHFLPNRMFRILNAGRTRNHIRSVRFSVSSIHIFLNPCSSTTALDYLHHTGCRTAGRLLSDHLITVALKAV